MQDSSQPPDDSPRYVDGDQQEPIIEAVVAPASEYESIAATKAGGGPESPEAAKSSGPVRLPQPNLLFAFLLTWLPLFVQIVGGVVIVLVVLAILISSGGSPDQIAGFFQGDQPWLLPIGTGITVVVAVGTAILFYGSSTRRRLAFRGLSISQTVATVMIAFPLAVLANEFTTAMGEIIQLVEPEFFKGMRESNSGMFMAVAEQGWLFVFISGCLLPGLGEEIFCRGIIGRGLVARWGILGGVFWTSLFFGLMHVEPIQATGTFLLGAAFHLVFLTTRSMLAPILLHALNNTLAFASIKYADFILIPGLAPNEDEEVVHLPVYLVAVAGLSALVWCAYLIRSRTQWRTPSGEIWSPGFLSVEEPAAELGCRPERRTSSVGLLLLGFLSFAVLAGAVALAQMQNS